MPNIVGVRRICTLSCMNGVCAPARCQIRGESLRSQPRTPELILNTAVMEASTPVVSTPLPMLSTLAPAKTRKSKKGKKKTATRKLTKRSGKGRKRTMRKQSKSGRKRHTRRQ